LKNYFKTHPYAKTGLLVIPVILLIVAMENFFPDFSPDGFPNFIVAFEFTNTLQDLNLLLDPLSPTEIGKIDEGNYIDFGFMMAYSLFLILFFRKTYKIYGSQFLLAGIPISILILAADFYENFLLLKITDTYLKSGIAAGMQLLLDQLHIVTWVKWQGLAIAFLLLFPVLIRGKSLSKITAILCLLPIIQGILYWVSPVFTIAGFTLSVFGAFGVLFILSFAFRKE
jgi:hypothetical protein